MLLFLLRHGIAEDFGPDGTDGSRPLSARGRQRFEKAAVGLAAMIDRAMRELRGQSPGDVHATRPAIFSSPKVRAWDTAEILASVMGGRVNSLDTLADDLPRATWHWLATEGAEYEALVLTGHQPQMGLLAGRLLRPERQDWMIDLKKGACIHLNTNGIIGPHGPEHPATLQWLLPPWAMRQLRPD
ncbi:MAG: hypothetical protein JJU36_08190 [Phycisphaeraceae bacterium]|nr:hypothetical protein [Phycisphaeraceae bacterium]